MTGREIPRFTIRERSVHWIVALSFVFLMLTGLAFFSPKLFWLASLFGGGQFSRILHPWVGIFFVVIFLALGVPWLRDMIVQPWDWEWLARWRDYLTHREETLPEAGRFNAGQKALFWTQAVSGLLLLLSGIPLWNAELFGIQLWSPKSFPAGLRGFSILIHEVAALAAIVAFIAHIYMALFQVKGALKGMTRGFVTRGWARVHHGRWYREVMGGR